MPRTSIQTQEKQGSADYEERKPGKNFSLTEAGFGARVREKIRWNVWLKLWGNVCFNPISALTGATLDRITSSPPPGQSSGTKCPCCRTWNAAARWKLTRWLPLSRNWDYSPVSQRQPSMLCCNRCVRDVVYVDGAVCKADRS